MVISFQEISDDSKCIQVLYDLLKSRTHGISHIKIPTLEDHSEFVRNHPHRAWFLVKYLDKFIGSIYLTDQNSIGINIFDEFIKECLPHVIKKIESEFEPPSVTVDVRSF